MSFLSGLNSFAGGLASGLSEAQRMKQAAMDAKLRQNQDKREQSQADRTQTDWQDNKDMETQVKEAWNRPYTSAAQLEGPGYDNEEMARSLAAAPVTSNAAPLSTMASAMPGIAGAPTPQAPPQQQALPPTPAAPAAPPPQPVQYQDPHTGRWYNLPPDQVRPPTDAERAQAVAQVYYKEGKASQAEQYLSNFFTSHSQKVGLNREETADALTRSALNPDAFAATVNDKMLAPYGVPYTVKSVMVPGPDGKQFPALQINRAGSAAPPMFLDSTGNPTQKPSPSDYPTLTATLISEAKGDGGVGLLSALTNIDSVITNKAINLRQEGRAEQAFPLEQAGRRANVVNAQDEHSMFPLRVTAARQGINSQAIGDVSNYGMDPGAYANVPFSAMKPRLLQGESKGDYNAVVYDTPGGSNAAGVKPPLPISQMSLGQVQQFQSTMDAHTRGLRGPDDPGTSAVGAYQFEKGTLAGVAPKVFGPDWQKVPFTPANQDKLAEYLYNNVRGNAVALNNTWPSLGQRPGGGALPPAMQRQVNVENVKNVRERLEAIRSKAADIVGQQYTSDDAKFGPALTTTMLQLLQNEPPAVRKAFNQAYGVNTKLLGK